MASIVRCALLDVSEPTMMTSSNLLDPYQAKKGGILSLVSKSVADKSVI